MRRHHQSLLFLAVTTAATTPLANASELQDAFVEDANLSLQSRFATITREFKEAPQTDREQSVLGLRFKYETGKIADSIRLVTSIYHVEEVYTSGAAANDLLPVNPAGDQEERFTKFGEAYVELTPFKNFSAKVGYQPIKSLLKSSSGQRAIPDTYQGISAAYKLGDVTLYSQWYNKWSRRHDKDSEKFTTDLGAEIDHIWINGLTYKKDALTVDAEILKSANFLQKTGLRASYYWPLGEDQRFTAKAGVFTSDDDGSLFVVGAEAGELDDEDAAAVGSPSNNNGFGAYVQGIWDYHDWKFTTAVSKFDETWIEDNHSGDHGTNPFPTRSIIFPDFSNSNETAYLVGVEYDWHKWVPGLSTAFNYSKGEDIENSVDKSLGEGSENYREIFIKYNPNWLKGLAFQWRIHDYRGKKTGNVDGVKGDDFDNRIFVDYTYKF